MKGNKSLSILSLILLFITTVWGACKSGETDPWKPHPPISQRVYTYPSDYPVNDRSSKSGTMLDILSYNVQSGLSQSCVESLNLQAGEICSSHLFGLQEVDDGIDLRGNVNQPDYFSKMTGHKTLYLNTILYRTGKYGSLMGTSFPVLESRYYMFQNWIIEERGVLAIRTEPFQLQGRTLWFLNTHFHYDGDYWKQKQAEETVAFAKTLAKEFPQALIVMTGDFYVIPGVQGYSTLETFFQNAWSVYNGSPNGGETYPAIYPSNRYDHIWYRFPSGTNYTLWVEVPPRLHSDHRPLWAHFDFPTSVVNPPQPIGGCDVRVEVVPQGDPWQTGTGVEGQFLLEVYNTGNKVATRVNFDLVLASGSSVTQWWNFAYSATPSSTFMDLPVLSPGSSYYSAGFILTFPSSPNFIAPTITYRNTICN